MKLNFTSLAYFLKVAELEHLTRAAEELHIAQPALTRTIRGLEKELNVTLFDHKGRNIHLTRDGHILLKYARTILGEYEKMEQEFRDSRSLQQSTVTLSILTATKFIPSFLVEFKNNHPSAHIQLVNASSKKEATNSDLTIFDSNEPIENDHTITLFIENLVMLLPKMEPYTDIPSITLSDLRDAHFIAPPAKYVLRSVVEHYCQEAGFTPQVVMESDNPETTREFVRAGLGVALVPQLTWHDALLNSHYLPIRTPSCRRYINLSWRTDEKLSLTAVLLRETIVDHLWEYIRSNSNDIFPM